MDEKMNYDKSLRD